MYFDTPDLAPFMYAVYSMTDAKYVGERRERFTHVDTDMFPYWEEVLERAEDMLEAMDISDYTRVYRNMGRYYISHEFCIAEHGSCVVQVWPAGRGNPPEPRQTQV